PPRRGSRPAAAAAPDRAGSEDLDPGSTPGRSPHRSSDGPFRISRTRVSLRDDLARPSADRHAIILTPSQEETTVKQHAENFPASARAAPNPVPPQPQSPPAPPTPPFPPFPDLPPLPAALLPPPTRQYRQRRKARRATFAAGTPRRMPIPPPVIAGTRVLKWQWNPEAGEIGVRAAFLPGHILPGPKDAPIAIEGIAPVIPNVLGDLIATPNTAAFDAIHTFTLVRQVVTMFQHALFPTSVPWQWNGRGNTEPIHLFPRAGDSMNAFYSRKEQALNSSASPPPGALRDAPPVYPCRSQDIVAHETGHAVLDGLKPNWILTANPPQTGALHESFA